MRIQTGHLDLLRHSGDQTHLFIVSLLACQICERSVPYPQVACLLFETSCVEYTPARARPYLPSLVRPFASII